MSELSEEALIASARAMAPVLAPALVAWQRQAGRHHLPWQRTRDPYRVWLSEIMLQQTQVSTVLGYYDRFLQAYPTVADLAAAPLDDVLGLWAGLGYYSRARNLHRCAQAVVNDHGGQFPDSAALLEALPGIGRSTAAAVAAFCFDARVPILDGNVKRVLTRVLGWGGDLAVARHERALWMVAQALIPQKATDMPAYTQGLMDLGATVCMLRKTDCGQCPWQKHCVARAQGQPTAYPVKTKKLKRSQRESWCLWAEHEGEVWMVQRPTPGIWAGLWTLPLFASEEALRQAHATDLELQPSIKHVLTHLDWTLHLRRVVLQRRPTASAMAAWPLEPTHGAGRWVGREALGTMGLPTPFRRWLLGA
jgi:A/G-specific adenine glycosylase